MVALAPSCTFRRLYRTALLFSLSALLGFLWPSVMRAERVQFNGLGISINVPEGWSVDSNSTVYMHTDGLSGEGMAVLRAQSSDGDARFFLYGYRSPGGNIDLWSTSPSLLSTILEMQLNLHILDSSEINLDAIKTVQICGETSDPDDRAAITLMAMIRIATNGCHYTIITSKKSGSPENDPALANIIGSVAFFEPRAEDYTLLHWLKIVSRHFLTIVLITMPVAFFIQSIIRWRRIDRANEETT